MLAGRGFCAGFQHTAALYGASGGLAARLGVESPTVIACGNVGNLLYPITL